MPERKELSLPARGLLAEIHSRFSATAEWPRYRELQVDMVASVPPFHRVIRELEVAHIGVHRPIGEHSRCMLTMEAFRSLDGIEGNLGDLAAAARYLAARYLEERGECLVGGTEIVTDLGMTDLAARRVFALIENDLSHVASQTNETDTADRPVFRVRAHAHYFRDVSGLDDFLEAERLSREAASADHGLGPRHEEALRHFRSQSQKFSLPSVLDGAPPDLHPFLKEACGTLLGSGHWSQVVLEAARVMEAAIKGCMPNEKAYGSKLVAQAFGGARPRLAINPGASEAQHNEQRAIRSLAHGLFELRNAVAHGDPIIVDQEDALAALAVAGMILRRLDQLRVDNHLGA